MELKQFFIEGFGSHDLADALQELGRGDDVFEADATKGVLAGILANLPMSLSETLDGFYPLALSNACGHFGVEGGSKTKCIESLVNFVSRSATTA